MNNQRITTKTDQRKNRNDSLISTEVDSQFLSFSESKSLICAAVIAGKNSVLLDSRPPALDSYERYIYSLVNEYRFCRQFLEGIEKAICRFDREGNTKLKKWAKQKYDEEQGHHLPALNSINLLGYQGEKVVKVEALISPVTKSLNVHLTNTLEGSNPIDILGYVCTSEFLSACIGKKYIKKVEALLPPSIGIDATRCLRIHSSVGADANHFEEMIQVIAELTSKERKRVAIACYETSRLYFTPPKQGYITNQQIKDLLKPFKLH